MADPVLAWALTGVGAFGQLAAALLARRSARRLSAGGRALGRVIGNEETMVERSRGSPRRFYFPLIEFDSGGGTRMTVRSDTGRPVPAPVGQEVPLVFDPAQPAAAKVATFRALWFFPLLTSASALPFLIAGLVSLA